VHGLSARMNQLCAEAGYEVQMLRSPSGHSSRYTPPELRDIYVAAAEMVNQELVATLRQRGIDAMPFLGADVALQAERKKAIRAVFNGRARMVRDDHSGRIRGVATAGLRRALAAGRLPVVPPLAQSADGFLNVDGDRAAAAVAGALGAECLLILSNVRGLYRDFPAEASLIDEVPAAQIEQALNWAQGRMKRKVIAAGEALEQGVARVIIGDGRAQNPVSRALAGAGTRFTA